jgi:hypothetical protein
MKEITPKLGSITFQINYPESCNYSKHLLFVPLLYKTYLLLSKIYILIYCFINN